MGRQWFSEAHCSHFENGEGEKHPELPIGPFEIPNGNANSTLVLSSGPWRNVCSRVAISMNWLTNDYTTALRLMGAFAPSLESEYGYKPIRAKRELLDRPQRYLPPSNSADAFHLAAN